MIKLKIGSKVLLVNKAYAFQNKNGGRVICGRLISFANIGGKVTPVFSEVGKSKSEITLTTHEAFLLKDLKLAVDSISIKEHSPYTFKYEL
jgi:hypothetical protein